mgnify:CR=1 FL=1
MPVPIAGSGLVQAETVAATAIDSALLWAWQELDRRTAGANIFAESRVLPAALAHCDPHGKAHLFLLWDGPPRASQLIGLMPLSLEPLYGNRPSLDRSLQALQTKRGPKS